MKAIRGKYTRGRGFSLSSEGEVGAQRPADLLGSRLVNMQALYTQPAMLSNELSPAIGLSPTSRQAYRCHQSVAVLGDPVVALLVTVPAARSISLVLGYQAPRSITPGPVSVRNESCKARSMSARN